MRKVVFILLITEVSDEGEVKTGIGPVFWHMIQAQQGARTLTLPGVYVRIVKKEIRGEMPEMQTSYQPKALESSTSIEPEISPVQ